MPVNVLDNNLYRINRLKVEYDKNTPYLTMNPGKSTACVICVSKNGPVQAEDLDLTEKQLSELHMGATLDFPEKGYSLQGVTRQELSAAPEFSDFKIAPPAYVQVWGMTTNINLGTVLYLPENTLDQCVLVPVGYSVQLENGQMWVWIQRVDGYVDGDLMYQVDDHKPIPIPRAGLNQALPIRPGVTPVVKPRTECEAKYVLK